MELSKDLENLLFNVNLKSSINILVTDEENIIYYIGKSENCVKYLYTEISDDLKTLINKRDENEFYKDGETLNIMKNDDEKYCCQCIFKVCVDDKFSKFIIFYKSEEDFNDDEIFLINSTIYLTQKYFN